MNKCLNLRVDLHDFGFVNRTRVPKISSPVSGLTQKQNPVEPKLNSIFQKRKLDSSYCIVYKNNQGDSIPSYINRNFTTYSFFCKMRKSSPVSTRRLVLTGIRARKTVY